MGLRKKRRHRSTLPQLPVVPVPPQDEAPDESPRASERPARLLHVVTPPGETIHGALDLFPAEVADDRVHTEPAEPTILSVRSREVELFPVTEPVLRPVQPSLYGPRRRTGRSRPVGRRRAAMIGLAVGAAVILTVGLLQSRGGRTSNEPEVLLVRHAPVEDFPLMQAVQASQPRVTHRAPVPQQVAAAPARAAAPPPRRETPAPAPARPAARLAGPTPPGAASRGSSSARRSEPPAASRTGTARPPAAAPVPTAVAGNANTPAGAAAARPASSDSSSTSTPPAENAAREGRETAAIRSVLTRYATAISGLDVDAVSAVWPNADAAALDRSFRTLEEQALAFNTCDISVTVGAAAASCRGTVRYVPKAAGRAARTERRIWQFSLRKAGEGWLISRVESH